MQVGCLDLLAKVADSAVEVSSTSGVERGRCKRAVTLRYIECEAAIRQLAERVRCSLKPDADG
jgi:hypothetical protein